MSKNKKIIITAIISIVLAIAVFIFYIFDPEESAIFPHCPFLLITDYKCPGCGTQRAIHDFLHLRIGDALKHNAFIVFAVPYIYLGIYIEYFGGKHKYTRLSEILFGRLATIIVFGGLLLYWVLRNITI